MVLHRSSNVLYIGGPGGMIPQSESGNLIRGCYSTHDIISCKTHLQTVLQCNGPPLTLHQSFAWGCILHSDTANILTVKEGCSLSYIAHDCTWGLVICVAFIWSSNFKSSAKTSDPAKINAGDDHDVYWWSCQQDMPHNFTQEAGTNVSPTYTDYAQTARTYKNDYSTQLAEFLQAKSNVTVIR